MDYAVLEARINSFKQPIDGGRWPFTEKMLTPEFMGKVGFYFSPSRKSPDMVKCFKCNGGLCGFSPTDNPVTDHKTNYPNCPLSAAEVVNEYLSVENLTLDAPHEIPAGWAVAKAQHGGVYYVNETTHEVSIEVPSAIPVEVSSFGTPKALSKQMVGIALQSLDFNAPL